MFEDEVWVPVEDLPHYLISNHGRIKHQEKPDQARKVHISDAGFPSVTLYGADSKTRYNRQINVLVARAFVPKTGHSSENAVWHIDGDLTNLRADNLRWEVRGAVLEWNEMHRRRRPTVMTYRVKNNRTGAVYENAFECGMAEGMTESMVIWRVERQGMSQFDPNARYRYMEPNE